MVMICVIHETRFVRRQPQMFESHMKPGPSNMFLERRFIKHGLTENNHLKIFKIVSEKRSGKDCYIVILIPYRSSHPEVFCKKGVLGNPTKFIGKHLCQSLFLIKLQPQEHSEAHSEEHSGPRQTSMIELFAKLCNIF